MYFSGNCVKSGVVVMREREQKREEREILLEGSQGRDS
jgi:hypothetical protein